MNENNNKVLDMEEIEKSAEAAEKLAEEAKAEEETGFYVHTLKNPFSWKGKTYTELRFQWDALTGEDYMYAAREVENRTGRMLVSASFDVTVLGVIAARACTERNEKGKRVLDVRAIGSIPIKDFDTIIGRARAFFLRTASSLTKSGS